MYQEAYKSFWRPNFFFFASFAWCNSINNFPSMDHPHNLRPAASKYYHLRDVTAPRDHEAPKGLLLIN